VILIAEQSRLIGKIGRWVLERSCRDRSRWLDDHPGVPLQLSVNVSGCQLDDPGFVATVEEVLDRTGMDPAALVLEITESEFIGESPSMAKGLVDLKHLGIGLAIDDFGTGYSSLGYLHRLPVDIIKIDGGLTADIDCSAPALVIVTAIVDLAHKLGLKVTAEGIENVRQRDELRAIGCDQAQGFLFARPAGATAIAALLGALQSGQLPLRAQLREGEPSAL
jgi:EAL domain-containing protein (putative c-di-GMP-specific phosphodiesterase class I)